jgi:hypothetical protein
MDHFHWQIVDECGDVAHSGIAFTEDGAWIVASSYAEFETDEVKVRPCSWPLSEGRCFD